ncbi:hypothetical protein B0H16DRAFT_533580 [Mycena metata]|uniref:Uncharacterized protein n=1 Tax=Mycena metata TaxID=1033252 RepID=A0AAD7H6S6_9AGAR|nr:hypothetical protein B0H16DRAFT_533580 [Mycena metata]
MLWIVRLAAHNLSPCPPPALRHHPLRPLLESRHSKHTRHPHSRCPLTSKEEGRTQLRRAWAAMDVARACWRSIAHAQRHVARMYGSAVSLAAPVFRIIKFGASALQLSHKASHQPLPPPCPSTTYDVNRCTINPHRYRPSLRSHAPNVQAVYTRRSWLPIRTRRVM